MIDITESVPPVEVLESLLEEANTSPFIGEIQLTEVQCLIDDQTIRFIYVDEACAGFGAWISINTEWDEVGPLFISEKFRGQGLGKHIIKAILTECQRHNTSLYGVTRNPAVKHIFKKEGFQQIPLFKLPIAVQIFALRKLTPRKLLRYLQKSHPEPVSHFIFQAD